MINISSSVLIANAFAAKQQRTLLYEELIAFKMLLSNSLIKRDGYVSFYDGPNFYPLDHGIEDSIITIGGCTFLKMNDCIISFNNYSFDEKFINNINSCYDEDTKGLLDKTRFIYREQIKRLELKSHK